MNGQSAKPAMGQDELVQLVLDYAKDALEHWNVRDLYLSWQQVRKTLGIRKGHKELVAFRVRLEKKLAIVLFGSLAMIIGVSVIVMRMLHAPTNIIRAPFRIESFYKPTNFMGDGEYGAEYVDVIEGYKGRPRPGKPDGLCTRIAYKMKSDRGFAGVYWVAPPGNWGEYPGYQIKGATKVTFWAAGETGDEVVEFKAGGIQSPVKRYFDTFNSSLGRRRLTKMWQHFEIDLEHQDLTDTIGAFAWVASSNSNEFPVIFYIDDIQYERKEYLNMKKAGFVLTIAVALIALLLTRKVMAQASQVDSGNDRKKLATLHAPFDISANFVPSGYMGDGEDKKGRWLEVNDAYRGKPRAGDADGICIRISYKCGPKGWAGVYWQYPDGNWGEKPGRSVMKATRLSFWAAGERGDEIVEVKSGGSGSDKPHGDSYEVNAGKIALSRDWAQHEISLRDQDLSNVIGAFAVIVTAKANSSGAVIYLNHIRFE